MLVLKANRKYITIFDPLCGRRKIPTEIFMSEWTKRALIPPSEKVKKKCETIYPDFINKRDKIILPILQVISGVSLLVGTYFINSSVKFYLPVIFFTLFIVFELLFRFELVNAMKRMDEEIFAFGFRGQNKNYMDIYKTIEKYRYHALTSTPSFLGSIMIATFISIILVMNSTINIVYIVLSASLAVINVFLYQPFFQNKSLEVADKESEINEVQSDYQFKMKSDEAHTLAYALGLNKNIYFYIEIAVLLLTIILAMTITKVINITYILFYLCISVFLHQTFVKMLEYGSKSEEFDHVKAKLINSIHFE